MFQAVPLAGSSRGRHSSNCKATTMKATTMDEDKQIHSCTPSSKATPATWIGAAALGLLLALAGACLEPAQAATDDDNAAAPATAPAEAISAVLDEAANEAAAGPRRARAAPHRIKPTLDGRVKLLSEALDLDAAQQAEVRRVLEAQREQTLKIWSDPSLPATYRISAMQAVSDQTADQIRALLNEEQRKKYNAPRQRPAADGSAKPDVEVWMNTPKSK